MIVFIAGKKHVVVPGARLGFDGCSELETKKSAPNALNVSPAMPLNTEQPTGL